MNCRESLKNYKKIVVKVGTTTLTYPNGRLNLKRIERLCMVLSDLRNQEKEIVLVSSGAIAVGADRLSLAERPRDTVGKQAASAVGQAILMQIYENFFSPYNQHIAQILMTKDVVEDKAKRFNATNTFNALLKIGAIPIVNENDTISIDEMGFSDNDSLSAYVSKLVKADLLIILSDINGFYEKDPNKYDDAELIPLVEKFSDELKEMADESSTKLGTGGMITKIMAAKILNRTGIDMVIASGDEPYILYDILEGKEVGTLFLGN